MTTRNYARIGIHLLDFELFKALGQAQQAVWCCEMRDRRHPEVRIGNELQSNPVQLLKADRLGLAGPVQADLAGRVRLLEHWQPDMAEGAAEGMQKALQKMIAAGIEPGKAGKILGLED